MTLEEYKNLVAEQGCIITGRPAELHHPRFCCGMSQRAADWLIIPLAPEHHRTGGFGMALHAGQATFEQNFGTEEELLARTIERVMKQFNV